MNSKSKFYLILLLLLLIPYPLLNCKVNISNNNCSKCRPLDDPTIAGENFIPSFIRTGQDLNISVEQEYVNTSPITLDPNNSGNNSLSIPTPSVDYSTTSIELNVSSIEAGNLSYAFDGDLLSSYPLHSSSYGVQTFYVPCDGAYLSNISLWFYSERPVDTTFGMFIYPTVWNDTLSCNVPIVNIISSDFMWRCPNATGSVGNGDTWWSHEFNMTNPLYLNNSISDNNTWSAFVYVSSPAEISWKYNSGNVQDGLYALYYDVDTLSWRIFTDAGNDALFYFNYSLSNNINPSTMPSDIGLMVNSTSVSDATSGIVGRWFDTTPRNGGTEKLLDFKFSCVWPSVSILVSSICVIFRNEFSNISKCIVYSPNTPYVNWNLSCGLSDLEPQLSNYRVNFSVPDIWIGICVFKAGEDISLTTTLKDISGSNFKIVMVNSDLELGYYTVIARSPQVDASIDIQRNNLETNIVYSSDLIEISFSFNALITGSLNVSFYTGSQIRYSALVDNPTPTDEIIFHNGLFDDLLQRDFNNYIIVILWYNETDTIYYSESFSYLLKTDLEVKNAENVLKEHTKDSFMLVRISYNELNGSELLNAIVDANISLISESEFQYSINFNESTGCYDVLIDCSFLEIGQHLVMINVNKRFCQSQSIDILIKLVEKQTPSPEEPWWKILLISSSLGLIGIIVFIKKRLKRR